MEELVENVHHKYSSSEQFQKHKDSMIRIITAPCLNFPQLLDENRFKVHPSVTKCFSIKERHAPLAERLNFFSEIWEQLTQDLNILSQSFKILFSQTPFQYGPPQLARVNQEERLQITSETKEMLRKDTIQQVKAEPGEFLSNSFAVHKKDGLHRLVMNLKFLCSFIAYQHFKME